MNHTSATLALFLAAAGSLAGCSSPCVAKEDRLVVDLLSAPTLNDAGVGPQHVRFQVWAVRDKAMFESARADALAESEGVEAFERQGMGRVFVTDSSWIKPASTRRVVLRVDEDSQYTHVGIAVLYPEARKILVPLDCAKHAGYTPGRPDHSVVFTLGTQTVEPGTTR
ncbi:MAG: hypothetical protein K8T90_15105 [Planctomycetes bacterium]|nr:hypothetical protein [Planctomycetota bacterium]